MFAKTGSCVSNMQCRKARTSIFESPQMISGEGDGFSIQSFTVFLKCSTEGAKISFDNSGSVTDAQACQRSSRE